MSDRRGRMDPMKGVDGWRGEGGFGLATRAWFDAAFAGPTSAQVGAWRSISAGKHTLVVAPTGSGKTLAGAGRRDHERVLPGADRAPRPDLGRGRAGERGVEPRPRGQTKAAFTSPPVDALHGIHPAPPVRHCS